MAVAEEHALSATSNVTDLTLRADALALERERFQLQKELALAKQKAPRISSGFAIAVVGVMGGVMGALGGAYVQGLANYRLEQKRFESSLILKAIETGGPKEATKNLIFLVRAGFLEDKGHQIALLANAPTDAPFLPSSMGSQSLVNADFDGYCKSVFGPAFHASDRDRGCVDGTVVKKVAPAELCRWQTGSPVYVDDPVSLVYKCIGGKQP
jgi:hypothetical protein